MSEKALGEERTGELVRRAQAGDAQSLEQWLTQVHGTVRRWARIFTGDADEADDVAQEVLIRVAQRLDRYAGRSRFTTWLYQVTRNTALGFTRRGRDVQFGTQVGVPVGKTAVLGNVGEDPRGALILTVKPELVSASP